MERYESLGLVGEGSYGTVLKCRHRDSGRLVAIKKFMDSDDDKTVKKIALREIKLLRQLRHDNLVNLLEVWKRRRRWYLVFEFVERTLLDDLEQNPNGLDLNTSRQYLYQILRAAAFCHQQHVIHRDIKPENILISQGGVVKMCDFGFARTMTSSSEGGVYTDYVATRWYRAPELLVGDTKYGKPVDVWAVGCLLIEMLTGQPLFPGDSDLDQIYHIVRCFGNLTAHHQELFYRNPVFSGVRLPECSGRVPLEQRFPTVPTTALDLAQSCLQMDPEKRAQCSELLEHPLFTQDSFHIRVLDELNAKIQKDHRENSTLPKIAKTPRREKDEGDDKNRRGKDKKQSEDMDVKVNKEKEKRDKESGVEKIQKSKGKQPLKTPKTIGSTSEPLTIKQTKTLGAKIINNASKTTVAMRICKEASPAHSTTALPKGTHQTGSSSDIKPTYDTSVPNKPSRDLPTDTIKNQQDTSNKDIKEDPGCLKMSLVTKIAANHSGISESPEPCSIRQQSASKPKITTESRTSTLRISTPVGTTIPKTLKVSDKENREDFALSMSIIATTKSLVNQTSKVSRSRNIEKKNNSSEDEPKMKSSNSSHCKSLIGEPKAKFGSFSTATMTQKTTFSTEAQKKGGNPDRNNTTNIPTSFTSTATPDHKASTRSFVFHNTADINGFDLSQLHSSPPPPPPPPSSTPLLLPLSSTPLIPSFCVVSTDSPVAIDHLTLGASFHPGTHSFWCVDKPRHHGCINGRLAQQSLSSCMTGSFTAQVSEKSLIRERSFLSDRCNHGNSDGMTVTKRKSDVHFPDLRSSVLPELRGREGKHNKGTSKDQRKDNQLAPSVPPSEPPQPGYNSTDSHSP
ncbi:uncharacterized protein [Pagrus major]|uniref:uncharacterized protein n=1 Tax=Pagrus major TaxID=143350 RepID=UPI003CC84BE8